MRDHDSHQQTDLSKKGHLVIPSFIRTTAVQDQCVYRIAVQKTQTQVSLQLYATDAFATL